MATTGIDFMAIARGRRQAENENWQDWQRAMAAERGQLQRDEWADQMRQRAINREAQAYVAPLINNWQRAADAGVSPTDFFIQQRQQITQDPSFQGFSPEVQNQVWQSLGNSVRAQLQDLQRQGLAADASRLASAYGLGDVTTPLDRAAMSGNVNEITDALQQMYGSNITVNPNNTVTILGEDVPLDVALPGILRSRQVAGAFPAAAATRMSRQAQERQDALRAQEYAALGFVQDAMGRWHSPNANPQVTPTGVQTLGVGAADLIPAVPGTAQVQQMPLGRAATLVQQAMGAGPAAGAAPALPGMEAAPVTGAALAAQQRGVLPPTPEFLLNATNPAVLASTPQAAQAQQAAEQAVASAAARGADRNYAMDFALRNPGIARAAVEQMQQAAAVLQQRLDTMGLGDPAGVQIESQLGQLQQAIANYTLGLRQYDQLQQRRQ